MALPFVLPAVDFAAEDVCLRHMFARTPLDALHRAQPESEKYYVNFSRGPNPVAELVSHLALSANGIARTWQTVIRAIAAPIQICPIQ
jgi:hypothetical protein